MSVNLTKTPTTVTPLLGWTLIKPVVDQRCGLMILGSTQTEPAAGVYLGKGDDGEDLFMPDFFTNQNFCMRVPECSFFTASVEAVPLTINP